MLVFWISAPIFGLITAILFGFAELGLLASLLNIVNIAVCSLLSNGKSMQIRRYRRWVFVASLASVFAFVLVETILSLSSDPSKEKLFETHKCLWTLVGSGKDDDGAEAEAIQFRCTEVNGTNVFHRTGNFSLETGAVQCHELAYYYEIKKWVPYNKSMGLTVRSCTKGICAATAWEFNSQSSNGSLPRQGILYISHQIPKTAQNKEIELLPTSIANIDLSNDLKVLSKRAANLYYQAINEEGELRRRALLGTMNENCPFVKEEVDVTVVASWALVFSAIIWSLSIFSFIVTLFLRRRAFFDMSNPLHWAVVSRHDSSRSFGSFPSVNLDEHGQKVIWITDFSKDLKDLRAWGSFFLGSASSVIEMCSG